GLTGMDGSRQEAEEGIELIFGVPGNDRVRHDPMAGGQQPDAGDGERHERRTEPCVCSAALAGATARCRDAEHARPIRQAQCPAQCPAQCSTPCPGGTLLTLLRHLPFSPRAMLGAGPGRLTDGDLPVWSLAPVPGSSPWLQSLAPVLGSSPKLPIFCALH